MVVEMGFVVELPGEVILENFGTGAFDNFQTVLQIPGGRFIAGHDYELIATGMIGGLSGFVGGSGADVIELNFTESNQSTLYTGGFMLNGLYPPHTETSVTTGLGTFLSDGGRGQPFCVNVAFNNAAGTPFELSARIRRPGALVTFPKYKLDQVKILVLDRTNFAAEPGFQFLRSSVGGPTLIPLAAGPALAVNTLVVPTAGTWLIFSIAHVTHAQSSGTTMIRTHDSGAGEFSFGKPMGFEIFGLPNSVEQRFVVAQMVTASGGFTLEQEASSDLIGFPRSTFHGGLLLAMELDPVRAGVQVFPPPTTRVDFWDEDYAGNFLSDDWTLADPEHFHFFACTACDFFDGNGFAHYPSVELNGGRLWGEKMYAFPASPTAINRNEPVLTHKQVIVPPGVHKIHLRGRRNPFDSAALPSFKLPFDGTDLFCFGFRLLLDFTPTPPVVEVPGPILEIIPDRETTLGVSSLTEMPQEPHDALPKAVEGVTRKLAIPRGDKITSPKFLKARRLYTLAWASLSEVEGQALADYFDGLLLTSGGTFKWLPPGDADAAIVPWTMATDEYTWRRQPDGTSSFSVSIVELVFYTA